MARNGKTLAVVLTLTSGLALVGASSAAPAPVNPAPARTAPSPIKAPPAPSGTSAPPPTSAVVALTAAQKTALLTQMNDLRASIGASSMQTLVWDNNLAAFATPIASTCQIAHSSASERTNVTGWVGTYVGENLAAGTAGITSLADATNAIKVSASLAAGVTNWWSEKPNYDYATNACQAGKQCGHYTQLVWAATKSVGCALVMCAPHKSFSLPGYAMVCEFGPGGNTLGKKPY